MVAIEVVTRTSFSIITVSNETELYRLEAWSMLQRVNLKCHIGQIAQYPGVCLVHIGCADAGNRTGVDQQSLSALDIGLPDDLRDMAVTAANQVVISGAGHAPAIMRVVGCKDAPSAKFQLGIIAVISKHPTGLCHQSVHRNLISEIVPVHDVKRNAQLDGCTQRIRSDQVATMDNGLSSFRLCFGYGRRKRICTVMTVGNYADFHCMVSCS